MLPTFNAARPSRESDPLFRREMRERWRRPLTLLQLTLFAGALAWLGYSTYIFLVPQGDISFDSLSGTGRRFFFAVALLHTLAWIPIGLLLAAPTLAAERERGHLFEWVLAGLTPAGIVRAKFRALAGFVLVMVCVPFPVFALCFPLGGVSPFDFISVGALTVVVALNAVAFGTMLSAISARVTSAIVSALVASAFWLFLGAPMLNNIVGQGWTTTLLLALCLGLGPLTWLSVAQNTFDIEIEKHIKGAADFVAENRMESAQRLIIGPDGHLAPPIFEREPQIATTNVAASEQVAESPPESPPESPSERAWSAPRLVPERPVAAFSPLEKWMLRAAQFNAIAHRDVRRKLQSRHAGSSDSEFTATSPAMWLSLWVILGVVGYALNRSVAGEGLFPLFAMMVLAPAMAQAALGAASGFTRERAQRMLSALQMTALSPADIVWGKVAGVVLLCAQAFGGPLISLCLTALFYGPLSALALAIFGVCCVVFTAMGSLTLSLWSRKTEIVALGALASIVALWWVLPTLYISASDIFRAPLWLKVLWIAPMRVLFNPTNDGPMALALLQLSAICVAGTFAMAGLCIRQLRRTRAEEEETGLFQRDLSRGLR